MNDFSKPALKEKSKEELILLVEQLQDQKSESSIFQKKYNHLFENNPFMLFNVDEDGIIKEVNEFGANELGYTRNELLNTSVLNIFFEEDLPIVKQHMQRCLTNRNKRFSWQLRKVKKDGTIIWVRETATCLSTFDGKNEVLVLCENINEWKKADEQKRRYEFIVNSSKNYLTLINKNFVYEAVNDAYCNTHNLKREEIIGKSVPDIWGEKTFSMTIKGFLEKCFNGEDVTYESWFDTKSLGRRYYEVRYHPYSEDGKEITHAVVLTIDISERKIYKTAVNRRDSILQTISNISADFLRNRNWKSNFTEKIELLGKAAGVSRVYLFENSFDGLGRLCMTQTFEWVAKGIKSQLNNPDMVNLLYSESGFGRLKEILSGGEIYSGLVETFPKNEKEFLQGQDIKSICIAPIFSAETFWGFIGFDDCKEEREWTNLEVDSIRTVADIIGTTIRRNENENELTRSKERFQLAIESSNVEIWDINILTKEIYTSGGLKKSLGYSEDEYPNYIKFWLSRVHKEDRDKVGLLYNNFIQGKSTRFESEIRICAKDDSLRWFFMRGTVLKDKNGTPARLMGTAIETTEKILHQKELVEAKERAEHSDKLKSEFLAQMSHEVRTPLHVILSYSEIIQDDLSEGNTKNIGNNLEVIKLEGRRIINTVDSILLISELNSGNYVCNKETFNVYENVIESVMEEYVELALKKRIKIKMCNNSKCKSIKNDLEASIKIFKNIIDNAIKFTPENGNVVITLEENKDDVHLIVDDDGIGIDENYIGKVFDTFSQEDHGYSRKFEGNGLGLSVTKKLCDINNININIESKKGKGTKVRLSFPLN